MRKLIFGTNISLDGCCDHTKFGGGDNEDIHVYFGKLMQDAGVFLYGRKTYELMVPFWPDVAKNHSGPTKAINEFAQAFDSVEKIVVFSKTLDKADAKTRIVRSDLQDEIMKLKHEQGKDILTGGVDIPSQLMQLGLIDEYHFVVHPTIVGEGRRLLEGISLPEALQLKLAESKVFKSGCVALRYLKQ